MTPSLRLIIDKLQFDGFSVGLPILLTEPGLMAAPTDDTPSPWYLDTGFSGEAFAWVEHLQAAGIDPARNLYPRRAKLIMAAAGSREFPIRKADLWLVSNIDELRGEPWPLPLARGVVFRDDPLPADSGSRSRPLIGMWLLNHSKLKIELDFSHRSVSIWVPD